MSFEIGQQIAERTVHLTRESLVRYAGASGDFNPIHYRDDVAASVGLPGVLAHGMLTMGLAIATVEEAIGDTGRIVDYGVRFAKPVIVDPGSGADVTISAVVGAVSEETVRIDLKVTAAEQTVLTKAQLQLRRA